MGRGAAEQLNYKSKSIIDYANSNDSSDIFDIYLLKNCNFLISSDCGITIVPEIFNKPILYTNWILIHRIPRYCNNCVVIFKKIYSNNKKIFLNLKEMINLDVGNLNTPDIIKHHNLKIVDNTKEEILAATVEMNERINGTWKVSKLDNDLQIKFWNMFGNSFFRSNNFFIGSSFFKRQFKSFVLKIIMKFRVPIFDLKVKDKIVRNHLISSFNSVLNHGKLFLGPEVDKLEKKLSKFLNIKYVLALSSGSSAIYLAMKSSGIKKGDEVIVSTLTWIIPVNAILMCGAKPVFADVDKNLNIDPISIKQKISKKTKAILCMHYAGKLCNMNEINKIAKINKLKVFEDAAQSFGAKLSNKYSGTFSNAAGFSTNPMKPFNGYTESGFLVTNSKKIYEKAKILRHAGTLSDYKKIITNQCIEPSLNHKADSVGAALLLTSLSFFKKKMKMVNKYAEYYEKNLPKNVKFQTISKKEVHGRYVFAIIVSKRDQLAKFLNKKGIETKIFNLPLVYDTPFYKKYKNGKLPNAEKLIKKILIIPCHEKLNLLQIKYVTKSIIKFYS